MQKRRKSTFFGLITLAVLAVWVCLVSCDDSTGPDGEPDEHLFYIAPKIGNMVKVFSVEQESIVDSFVVDSVDESWDMQIHVIGNDSLLAVSSESKTYIVDLESKQVICTYPYETRVFSRDSRYFFHYNQQELRTFPENGLVTGETGALLGVAFCNQSETVTYVYPDFTMGGMRFSLGIYFLTSDSICNHLRYAFGEPIEATFNFPIASFEKAYVGISWPISGLVATDFASDTVKFLKQFDVGAGIVPLVAPNDEYVFVSDYGVTSFEFVPSEHIFVFDAETEDSIAAIAYQGIDMVYYMIISHDSKYLVARPLNEFEDITSICLIDAENFEVIGAYDCGFLPGSISAKYAARNGW